MNSALRTVPDTNVIIAAQSLGAASPNREFVERWQNEEFELLYSEDTLREYIQKLLASGVPREKIFRLIVAIRKLGAYTTIQFFHLIKYPADPDDIPFLLCAHNGQATHLISYDPHLLDLNGLYPFKICKTLDFLFEVRQILPG